MKDIIFLMKDAESGLNLLFNLHIATHGQVHQRGSDIARMNGVVNQCARFRRRHALGRFIHRGNGETWVRIASLVPPQSEHHSEGDQRQKNNGIASQKPS